MKKLFLFTILTMALGPCCNIQPMNPVAHNGIKAVKTALNLIAKRYKGTKRYNNNSFPQILKIRQKNFQNKKDMPLILNNKTVINQAFTQTAASTPKSSIFSYFKQDISNRAADTLEGFREVGKGITWIYRPHLAEGLTNSYQKDIAALSKNTKLCKCLKYLKKEKLESDATSIFLLGSVLETGSKLLWTFIGATIISDKLDLYYSTKMRLKKNFKEANKKIKQYGNPFN